MELPDGMCSPPWEHSSLGCAAAALQQHPESCPHTAWARPGGHSGSVKSQWVRSVRSQSPVVPAIKANRSAPGPNCSSSCTVRAQGPMALMRHLHLILLLLVALHARTVWTSPWQAREADEGGSNDDAAAGLDVGLEPLGDPGDPLKVESSPTSSPDPSIEPVSNFTGPPRAKDQAEGGKKSPSASEILRQILKGLGRGHERDQEAMQEEVFPEGRSNLVPVRAEETEAMQATGMLGAVGEKAMIVPNPERTTNVDCPADVRSGCMIATAVILFFLLIAIISCCIAILYQKKKKQFTTAVATGKIKVEGRTVRIGSPNRWTRRQQLQLLMSWVP